jgi:hypothetical protein
MQAISSPRFSANMPMPTAEASETVTPDVPTAEPIKPQAPEVQPVEVPEQQDKATFAGKSPKFGAAHSDAVALTEAVKALTSQGFQNPLNWIAVSAVGIATHTGIQTGFKNFRQIPILQSIEASLRRVGNAALALNPNPVEAVETAKTIITKEVSEKAV